MSDKSISTIANELDAVFDQIVAEGTDDELFASGYLRGHFDLVVARLTMAGEEQQSMFWPALYASINEHAAELSSEDKELVEHMIRYLQAAV